MALAWIQLALGIKTLVVLFSMIGIAHWLYKHGKQTGVQEVKDKITDANRRAENERDNVEDRVRNTPDTVVDDELDPFMRD